MKQCIEKIIVVEEIKRLIESPILYKSENVETRITMTQEHKQLLHDNNLL